MLIIAVCLLQVLTLLPVTVSQELSVGRTEWPSNKFFASESLNTALITLLVRDRALKNLTGTDCEVGGSQKRKFKPGNDDKCHKSIGRTSVWIYPDPQPEATQQQGCILLLRSDDCSEIKGPDPDWASIHAIQVDYNSPGKSSCTYLSGHRPEADSRLR